MHIYNYCLRRTWLLYYLSQQAIHKIMLHVAIAFLMLHDYSVIHVTRNSSVEFMLSLAIGKCYLLTNLVHWQFRTKSIQLLSWILAIVSYYITGNGIATENLVSTILWSNIPVSTWLARVSNFQKPWKFVRQLVHDEGKWKVCTHVNHFLNTIEFVIACSHLFTAAMEFTIFAIFSSSIR